ncbi:MAG: MnhB domain-containing protein [Candidatus Diapherotrites archaeon]
MNGLSTIVRTVALILFVPVLVLGFYVIAHGHLTPGGGFQGGTIIATSLALVLVAFGGEHFKKAVSKETLKNLESIGLTVFIGAALLGLGATFFANFLANSGLLFGKSIGFGVNPGYINTSGTIAVMNFAVGTEVAVGLSLVLMLMFFSSDSGMEGGEKK